MNVVLDTNIVFRTKQRLLQGSDIDAIALAPTSLGISLVIPEIVFQELANLYRRAFREFLKNFHAESSRLKALVPEGTIDASCRLNEDDAVLWYENQLKRRLKELNAVVWDYESIPNVDLVQRCLESRKPFKRSGDGLRDALIWESVLQHAESNNKTMLVTGNFKDFADPQEDSLLHPDLRKDLSQRGLSPDCMRLFRSLNEFVAYMVENSNLLKRENVEATLNANGHREINELFDDVGHVIAVAEGKLLEDVDVAGHFGESLSGVRIIEIDPNTQSDGPWSVYELNDKRLIAGFTSDHFCEIEFLIDRDAGLRLARKGIIDATAKDWGEGIMHASAALEVSFGVNCILDADTLKLISWDITPLEIISVLPEQGP